MLKSLLWLRRENLNQGHIYIRPAGPHGLSLIDDLNAGALARMKAASTRAAKMLAKRYGGDRHRADLAWARHAAAMGLSASEIHAAIMEARDLAKKGAPRRQREYVERTAYKAIRQAK